jgi:hypothetical protein
MRQLDAFSAQLVDFVRNMPDDALLALVRAQLAAARPGDPTASQVRARVSAATGAFQAAAAAPARGWRARRAQNQERGRGASKRLAKRSAGAAKKAARQVRASAADREKLLESVERIVKTSSGVSASEVAHSASVPQSRASSALKELKLQKRIFQGGDRRFARYAGDAKTAQGASDAARKTASGPVSKRGKR